MSDFEDYIRQDEPNRQEKAKVWRTAIGLQAVDGLTTSDYLRETACRHIEGEISIDDVRKLIKSYYKSKAVNEEEANQQEADDVSVNITAILSTKTLNFSTNGFISLHRRIFENVFKHAGKIRDYDITKKEWVLDGDTVSYLNWQDLRRAIDYDLEQERNFSYVGIKSDELVAHISKFISGLWQIHPFCEGNTRTTAVFVIQYLRSIGFDVDNEPFANNSWYFRNALVRANYKNALKGIDYSPVYLERFFRNLLLGEHWDLRSRYLHIKSFGEWTEQPRRDTPTSTPTSTPASTNLPVGQNVSRLVAVLDEKRLSVKELLQEIGLKDRVNFVEYSLKPAIKDGFVTALYPDKPRHPRQKYLLTTKGRTLLSIIKGNKSKGDI